MSDSDDRFKGAPPSRIKLTPEALEDAARVVTLRDIDHRLKAEKWAAALPGMAAAQAIVGKHLAIAETHLHQAFTKICLRARVDLLTHGYVRVESGELVIEPLEAGALDPAPSET